MYLCLLCVCVCVWSVCVCGVLVIKWIFHQESEIVGGGMFYESIHRDTFAQELQLLTR